MGDRKHLPIYPDPTGFCNCRYLNIVSEASHFQASRDFSRMALSAKSSFVSITDNTGLFHCSHAYRYSVWTIQVFLESLIKIICPEKIEGYLNISFRFYPR